MGSIGSRIPGEGIGVAPLPEFLGGQQQASLCPLGNIEQHFLPRCGLMVVTERGNPGLEALKARSWVLWRS